MGGGGGGGRGGLLYRSLHCHHQNDSCIKLGSNESHFKVSLIVRDKVTRQRPQTTTFEEKGEPKRILTEIPLLTSLSPYRQAKPAHHTSTGVTASSGRGTGRRCRGHLLVATEWIMTSVIVWAGEGVPPAQRCVQPHMQLADRLVID